MYSSKKTGEKEVASHHASAGELGELGDVDEDAVMLASWASWATSTRTP
jgi:hypothetical protein